MWDTRYRPLKFSDVLGQTGTVQVLKARLKAGTALDISYIFSGGHGQGKTTLARILARSLLCQDIQDDSEPCNECDNCTGILSETTAAFSELDAASKGTIDNMRAIVNDLPFVIPGAPKRVYLFDEAHRMSRDAQDVLLKPVEDKKLVGIFCTTEPAKIRGAIKSRCEEYAIRKITREDILGRMKWILGEEQVEHSDDALMMVIDYSGGHVRDVVNRLEMIAQMGPITEESVREYLNLSIISAYYEVLLLLGEPAKAVQLVEQACDSVGVANVASGIAEAAMNSYRLAHGMFADFTFVDREAAQKVYTMYGDDVVKLAGHFLGSGRYPSKVGLICDVLACSDGTPAPKQTVARSVSPVKVTAPAPVSSVSPVTPLVPVEPSNPPAPQLPQGAPEAAPEASEPEPTPKEPVATEEPTEEPQKLGEPSAKALQNPPLTDLDDKAISDTRPRGSERDEAARPLFKGVSEQEPEEFIPAARFRQEFSQAWNHSRGDA